MQSIETLPDTCTADEAVSLTEILAPQLGIHEPLPDVRTLRLWRSKKYLTIAGRHFTRRNLLEILVILKLRQDGLAQQHAIKKTLALDDDRLQMILVAAVSAPAIRADAELLITLQLLAQGILKQYRDVVSHGAIVGYTAIGASHGNKIPTSLQQAMARLGRLYLTEGQEDRTCSIHQLLRLCMQPLTAWAPRAFSELTRYQNAVLIDPDYLVPSEDCEVIAEEADGANLSDLIEHHLHEDLRNRLNQLGSDADLAYTTIREFVGRHPMATRTELKHLYLNPELNDAAIEFVRSLYIPVHASHASGGQLPRCNHCRAYIGSDGLCILSGCQNDFLTSSEGLIPLSEALVARPEVLKYWADPAREELRLYDALREHKALKDCVKLYPHSDWCDVSIDEEIGIDVKDYHDPVRLAQRMNHSLGNLSYYSVRVLAIAKRRWSPTYRDRLIEQLSPDRLRALRVMSVSDAITHVKHISGGNRRA